jgi:hypothetical protein
VLWPWKQPSQQQQRLLRSQLALALALEAGCLVLQQAAAQQLLQPLLCLQRQCALCLLCPLPQGEALLLC